MSFQGPNSPGTMADDATVGTEAWANPNNAKVSDNVYATPIEPTASSRTHYLKATNFGFSVPSGATIDGILVEIEGKSTSAGSMQDYIVKIVKSDGSIGTVNKADTGNYWNTTEEYKSYGSSSDLWGETWTSEDVNNSNFGMVLSAQENNTDSGSVDHTRITVYYTSSSVQGIGGFL